MKPFLVLLTVLLSPGLGGAADLFTPVADPPTQSDPAADLTLRSRAVHIDFAALRRARTALATPTPSRKKPSHDSKALATPPGGASGAGGASAPEAGAVLTLNLFDDVVVRGRVEHTAPTFSGGYSLSGHLVADPLSTFTLVVNGETVAGTVQTREGTYRIQSVGAGVYAVNEIDRSQLPECGVDELAGEDGKHPFH